MINNADRLPYPQGMTPAEWVDHFIHFSDVPTAQLGVYEDWRPWASQLGNYGDMQDYDIPDDNAFLSFDEWVLALLNILLQ